MIYIVAPGNHVTGGPETLHQAANLISSMGYPVQMYYTDPHTTDVPERYQSYGTKTAAQIEDSASNLLIVPEAHTWILGDYRKIRKCIWWLSVDNYKIPDLKTSAGTLLQKYHLPKVLLPVAELWKVAAGKYHRYYYHFEDNGEIFHAYNCEYARKFIIENGIREDRMLYLCGPLNGTFFETAKKLSGRPRENIILYNPKKGKLFTQKIIAAAKERGIAAMFVPLKGMTPNQIAEYMSRARVYMDFGTFPGPERIPREAVTMGCNIITSQNGAAANEIDVPIPEQLKFADREDNIPCILDVLQDMLNNYDGYYHNYDAYRKKVLEQVVSFRDNMKLLVERA